MIKCPILEDFSVDANGNKIQFEGNPLLRPANIELELTKDHFNELRKCKNDFVYFIKNYLKIVNVDDGKVPFNLYDYQERLLRNIHDNRFSINMLSRQCGKSTTVSAYLIWFTLFHGDKTVGILANRLNLAKEILDRAEKMYMTLPKWMQQGLISFAKTMMEFENGSRIVVDSTSGSAGRGFVFNMLVLDEFAFTPEHIAEDFMRSVFPTISSGKTTKIVMISTPKGMNHFYRYYVNAKNSVEKGVKHNGYSAFRIEWDEVPGRDESFKQDMIDQNGLRFWNQEYDCQFLGSSDTLLSFSAFQNMKVREPIREILAEQGRLFEEAIDGVKYILGCDVSHGDGADNSAISVWRVLYEVVDGVDNVTFKQVFAWHDNETSFYTLPTILEEIGKYYNNALVVIEKNGIGDSVLKDLDDLHYDNIFGWDFNNGLATTKLGLRTNISTKNVGCNKLAKLIEKNKLLIQDNETYNEFNTFVKAKGSWAAEAGYTDDLVMFNVLLAFATGVPEFDYYIDGINSFKESLIQRELNNMYEDLSDLYRVDDGVEDWGWYDESDEYEAMIHITGLEENPTRNHSVRIWRD